MSPITVLVFSYFVSSLTYLFACAKNTTLVLLLGGYRLIYLNFIQRLANCPYNLNPLVQTLPIQISQLSYTYASRTVPAIKDITLDFNSGQVILIAGESGSGKTTLFRCINGLIPQSYKNGVLHGTIHIFSESTARAPLAQLARRIGTVLQDPEKQIVSAQVRHDIAFGLENLGMPREEIIARINSVAQRLHIESLLDRATHSLSGGERQKVAIAGVLVMRPQILLFDEPLASLDPRSARETLGLIRTLADDGVTIVMIEHRVQAALQAQPDQCIEMMQGQVVFQGNATAFLDWRSAHKSSAPANREGHTSPIKTSATTQPLLELRDVRFAYPDAPTTINRISLKIHAGDVIALMGPNGAGKSTLSKLAMGILRPNHGEVMIHQRSTASMSIAQMAQQVGYVFQHPSSMLFANTLREELSFGPRNIGLDKAIIDRNITQAIQQVNLAELPLTQSPFALSYGQQKRVAIASVLTMQPQLLILDEPTAGLDDATAQHLMNSLLFDSGKNRPQAIVLITHDLSLARAYANRMVVLAEGEIVHDSAPDVLLNDVQLLERYNLL